MVVGGEGITFKTWGASLSILFFKKKTITVCFDRHFVKWLHPLLVSIATSGPVSNINNIIHVVRKMAGAVKINRFSTPWGNYIVVTPGAITSKIQKLLLFPGLFYKAFPALSVMLRWRTERFSEPRIIWCFNVLAAVADKLHRIQS